MANGFIDPAEFAFYDELYSRRVWEYDVVSGAQIKVVLDGTVLLEDCTAIQFTLTQSKKPIYGYHSRYFDAVADGIVIVHGRLWINYVHQGYLRTLIKLAQLGGNVDEYRRLDDLVVPKTPEQKEEYIRKLASDSLTSEDSVVRFVRKKNEQVLEALENQPSDTRPDIISKKLDIEIHYGDRTKAKGVPIKVIYNVHFMAEGQDIQISGQPQQEWYEFLAQRVT